jgi:hypothetical protein
MICRDGMVDLLLDRPGCHELTPQGIIEINPLFRNFAEDGQVSGYGIANPGMLLERFLWNRQGTLSAEQRERMMNPVELGFFTSLVIEGAEKSLREGMQTAVGAIHGRVVDLWSLAKAELGEEIASTYMPHG